jgi:hypothetical protein
MLVFASNKVHKAFVFFIVPKIERGYNFLAMHEGALQQDVQLIGASNNYDKHIT